MSAIDKASPRPWSVRPDCETKKIEDVGGNMIAMLSYVHLNGRRPYEEVHANAALIVRAVNRDHLFDEIVEALNSVSPDAISALTHNQRQLDCDGCEVGVSRQALEELVSAYAIAKAKAVQP